MSIIGDIFSVPEVQYKYDDLSFTEKVYIGTMCRAMLMSNLCQLASAQISLDPIAPEPLLLDEMYEKLLDRQIIYFSGQSMKEAFHIEENGNVYVASYQLATYNINLAYPENKEDLLHTMLTPAFFSSSNIDDAFSMWKKIALYECLVCFTNQVNLLGVDYCIESKAVSTFALLLDNFSTLQIVGVIWNSIKRLKAKYYNKALPNDRIVSEILDYCEISGEKAIAEKWEYKNYNWPYGLKKSVLSQYFYNRVTKLGETAYSEKPNIETLKNLIDKN